MSGASEDKTKPSEPKYIMTEGFWEKAVLGGGALVFVLAFGLVLWTFNGGSMPVSDKLEIVWRSMVVAGGLLTFITVVWRGVIATRQADQQREQVDAQIAQLNQVQQQLQQAKDVQLAMLYDKAVEVIADTNNTGQIELAITNLRIVAAESSDLYSVPAMNALVDYISENSTKGHGGELISAAISALNQAHTKTGVRSTRRMELSTKDLREVEFEPLSRDPHLWRPILGVDSVNYIGGGIMHTFNLDRQIRQNGNMIFFGVTIWGETDVAVRVTDFADCRFVGCSLQSVFGRALVENTFDDCDFSGAEIDVRRHPNELDVRGAGCRARADDPPLWVRGAEKTPLTDWDFLEKYVPDGDNADPRGEED